MLPGKKYTPEAIVRLLLRSWWMILLPIVIGGGIAYVWAKRMPNQFMSETLIMLLPQRIPEAYVKTTVTDRIEDRLGTLSEQILSRSRLERIIVDLDLYSGQRQQAPMQDIVQRMRNEIDVRVVGKESFRVSYVSGNAVTAQKVTERLASLFIDENLRDRENMAEDTSRFLDSQLEDAKRRLIEQENKLKEYRLRHSGELPSQLQSNLQAIQNAEVRRRTIAEAADRDRESKLELERQLADLQAAAAIAATAPAPVAGQGTPENIVGGTTAQQLQAARASLQLLRLRNTPDHPDVRIMERRIADLEEKLKGEPVQTTDGKAQELLTPEELQRQRRIRDVEAQIAGIERQLSDYRQQDEQLAAVIRDYQARINVLPTRESELVELTRDYSTLQKSYESLLEKREMSKIAANLERRNIGEQFRVLDPARVPERPFSPDRLAILLIGLGAGLALGLSLVGIREYMDATFRTEDDIAVVLSLPVLASVPHMDQERSLWRLRRAKAVGRSSSVLR